MRVVSAGGWKCRVMMHKRAGAGKVMGLGGGCVSGSQQPTQDKVLDRRRGRWWKSWARIWGRRMLAGRRLEEDEQAEQSRARRAGGRQDRTGQDKLVRIMRPGKWTLVGPRRRARQGKSRQRQRQRQSQGQARPGRAVEWRRGTENGLLEKDVRATSKVVYVFVVSGRACKSPQ